jgi:MYXO-CTERM domain-containing protein
MFPAVLLVPASAHAAALPNYDAYYDKAVVAPLIPSVKLPSAALSGVATSFDTRRAVPRFIWASKQKPLPPLSALARPESAARWYLDAYIHRYGLTPAALDNAEVAHVHDTGRGGIIVAFRQKIGGVEVFRSDVKVLMARNLELVALAGSPRAGSAGETKVKGAAFKLSAIQALASGFKDLYQIPISPSSLVDVKKTVAGYSYFDLGATPEITAADLHLVVPSRVKKVFYAMPDRLVPAYYLEIQAGKTGQMTSDAYAYVISAEDGHVLYRQSLTEYDAFNYTVWADPADGRPLDGPMSDFTPHPSGAPDGSAPSFIQPIKISMEGFNHNPQNLPDPWLSKDAIQTLGNNVDAYTDDDTPDGYSNGDLRATVTAPKIFDRLYDLSIAPQANQSQSMAALTQIFYTTNWLHDYWYDSGFNEAAGNAQQNNFGRGGIGGDVLHAEGQDGAVAGSRNNANMSTPADGSSPRMQMFLWINDTASLSVLPSETAIASNTAAFGPKNFDLTSAVVLVDDGVAVNTNGCEPFVNDVAGKIALLDRGTCNFTQKAQNAQNAGASGLLVVNNVAGAPAPSMGAGTNPPVITIPALSTTLEAGTSIKTALQSGAVTLHMKRTIGIERDGTIDNAIVAHEWGHYFHHRLVNCGLKLCGGMSEGWADFAALQMLVRPGDNLDGTFALAIYSTVSSTSNPGYFGIRRYPYSVDMTKNGLTFKHLEDGKTLPAGPIGSGGAQNSEVHNAGEIWAGMLFEGLIALLKESKAATPRYSFEEARRRMADYVVAGMKLTPVEPTITEQRDAIVAAAYASDPEDAGLLAQGFAKRGAGSCAVSPPNDSETNSGVVESFAIQPNLAVLSLDIDDSVTSCNHDGALDAEEVGKATVKVMNTSGTTLTATKVTLASPTSGVVFPNGPTVTVPEIEPFSTAIVTIDVGLDSSVAGMGFLDLTANVDNEEGCVPSLAIDMKSRINYDNLANAANIDTVESDILAFTPTGDENASDVWQRVAEPTPENHAWHGVDSGSLSDTQLESPPLDVSATFPFIITFKHRYKFETDPTHYWDGSVIEISSDDGAKWEDISTYADPGYGGVINNTSGNPLMDRKGFVDQNPSYPAQDLVTINLANAFAGKTVKIRFRIGSDQASGDFGWELDNLAFTGITNTPFPTVIDDTTQCAGAHSPVADAGQDQEVQSGSGVILDGLSSSDPDDDPLTYTWTQTAGIIVPLTNAAGPRPTFIAPDLGKDTLFTFKLTVSDGNTSADDAVDILVKTPSRTTSTSSGTGSGEGGSDGAGGNPSGSATTSGNASAGSGGDTDEGGGNPVSTGNLHCAFRTAGADTTGSSVGAGLLGLAMLLFRRRRSQERARALR